MTTVKRTPWILALVVASATFFTVAAQQERESFDARIEQVMQLVVMVSRGANDPIGAGIVFGRNKDRLYVVTANHVVRRGEAITNLTVAFRSRPATPIAATLLPHEDRQADIAVLEIAGVVAGGIDPCSLPFDRLSPSASVKRGDPVYALGNPNGTAWGMPLKPEFVAQSTGDRIAFQSAFISAGHSGGALLDQNLNLAGLIRADQPPLGLAMDLHRVLATMKEWGYPVQLRAALPLDRTPLHPAAERGDIAEITRLLEDCGRVNAPSSHAETPLHFAASNGGVDAISLLVKSGAELDAEDGDGDTPLHWAVQKGQVAAITRLLQLGAAASLVNYSRDTPLHQAVARRTFGVTEAPVATRLDMVRALVQGGAAVNGREKWDPEDTPLHRAILDKQREIARMLIAAGAKPIPNDLTTAIVQLDLTVIEMLIAAGADLNAIGDYFLSPCGSCSNTPLNVAALVGRVDIAGMLVEAGADINRPGFNDHTPLAIAMREKKRDVEAFLLARGGRAKTGSKPSDERLLWEAVEDKRPDAVRRLIADGVDVNGTQGRALIKTLLWVALEGTDAEIVRMVVEAGADVNHWVLGQAPLSLAVKSGNPDVVAPLLRAKADPSEGGATGSSPLDIAISKGSLEIVRMLLDTGVAVKDVSAAKSALDLALKLGHQEIAALIRTRLVR